MAKLGETSFHHFQDLLIVIDAQNMQRTIRFCSWRGLVHFKAGLVGWMSWKKTARTILRVAVHKIIHDGFIILILRLSCSVFHPIDFPTRDGNLADNGRNVMKEGHVGGFEG
jgi:hypothetical protein